MKIYIDACCYSRPYDNRNHMAQPRVRKEVVAIMNTVRVCGIEGFSIIGSPMVEFEINKIKNDDKRQKVTGFYQKTITIETLLTGDIDVRAEELIKQNVKRMDAYHIAFAEVAGANYLLTTDDLLETSAIRIKMDVNVINPTLFLQEYIKWLQSLT